MDLVLNLLNNGNLLPLLSIASPNRTSDPTQSWKKLLPSFNPARSPPGEYGVFGMSDEAGRRHHCGSAYDSYVRLTLRVSEESTTDTEENAIANAAIMGCSCTPHGSSTPIASGIIKTL